MIWKSRCGTVRFRAAIWTVAMGVLALVARATPAAAQEAPAVSAAAAREAIAEGNRAWGRARVAYDRATFERMLAPDFWVQFPDRRVNRQEFIEQISTRMPGARLTRFDASVLTVEPAPDGGWTAVIQEKLEFERPGPDGRPVKGYALWITRDGWRETGGQWQITSSEAIGVETWRGGATPPFADWE